MTIDRLTRLHSIGLVETEYRDLEDKCYLEDRLEYSLEDWALAYPDWSEEQISYMVELVETEMDVHQPPISDEELGSMMGEAEHEGYDGWSRGEAVIIQLFVADVKRAIRLSRNEPDPYKNLTKF